MFLLVVATQAVQTASAATFEAAVDGLLGRIESLMTKDGRQGLFLDTIAVPIEGTEAGLRKEFADRLSAKESLKKLQVDNKFKADTFLDLTLEKDTAGTQALLKARLRKQDGVELTAVTSDAIDNTADLTRLLNLTLNQRVAGDDKSTTGLTDQQKKAAQEKIEEAKQEKLKEAFARSSIHISEDGFRASSDANSPYQIEIRTRDQEGKFKVPQKITIVKDVSGAQFAFVDLPLGTVFAVRVLNAQKDHDIGAQVLLDGINSFELSEVADFKEHGTWYIPKNEAGSIRGWFVNEKLTRSFETSSIADGLITTLKQTNLSRVGTINVSFVPAWTGPGEPPAVERAVKKSKKVKN